MRLCMMICLLCAVVFCFGQNQPENKTTATEEKKHSANAAEGLLQQPEQLQTFLNTVSKKITGLNNNTGKSTLSMLKRMQRKELKLAKKLAAKDSTAYKQLLASSSRFYADMQQRLQTPGSTKASPYIPYLDSLTTSMAFLQQQNLTLPSLNNATAALKQYQSGLTAATDIRNQLQQRKQQLNAQFSTLGLTKDLKALNKEVYYYGAQLEEYKLLLKDKKKIEQKVLTLLKEQPAFKSFMVKNSQLAQLFRVPDNYGSTAALAGLQTRSSVMQLIEERTGLNSNLNSGGGGAGMQVVQQQLQAAKTEMNRLKEEAKKAGAVSGGKDMDMPAFRPNTQRTKSFLKRLEYGFNIQTQRSGYFLPSTSDIGISLGYKLNDKMVIGMGMSYKLGFGRPWNDIQLTHEGVGLRSYTDMRIKGSWWISGGYELNYLQRFSKPDVLYSLDAWQQSGLVGLTKKIKAGKGKEAKLQLLWDFLSYQQVPKPEPLRFRIGYNFFKK